MFACLTAKSACGASQSQISENFARESGLSFSSLSVLAWLFVAPLHQLAQLKRSQVRTHVSPTLDSPSSAVFLWLCKNRSFSATMRFLLTLAVASFFAVLVNAQSSSTTRPVVPTSAPTASSPSASPSSAAPPSNATNVNVSAVLSLANVFRRCPSSGSSCPWWTIGV